MCESLNLEYFVPVKVIILLIDGTPSSIESSACLQRVIHSQYAVRFLVLADRPFPALHWDVAAGVI